MVFCGDLVHVCHNPFYDHLGEVGGGQVEGCAKVASIYYYGCSRHKPDKVPPVNEALSSLLLHQSTTTALRTHSTSGSKVLLQSSLTYGSAIFSLECQDLGYKSLALPSRYSW